MKLFWKTGLSLVLVLIVAFVGISAYLGYTMTRVDRIPVQGDPALLGLQYENVTFASRVDKMNLNGWFFHGATSDRVIIVLHGEKGNRADPNLKLLPLSADLVHHGYNVLSFDMRGHGESEGYMLSGGVFRAKRLAGCC